MSGLNVISRLGDDGEVVRLVACKKHEQMIANRWLQLKWQILQSTPADSDQQCVACPPTAGAR